jgi:hypothetical protein
MVRDGRGSKTLMAEFMIVHEQGTGGEVLVNLDSVTCARPRAGEPKYTIVEFQNGNALSIRETLADLVQRKPRS